jgi:hypothetical protein
VNAADVKQALYRRHPALNQFGGPGPWTCTEEWANIDFLAFAANSKPTPARARHARIGYEVKVSRGDYRAEVLSPLKRAAAVAFCHEFYFATPAGLLNDTEKEYVEPEWEPGDFTRMPCPVSYSGDRTPEWRADPGPCSRGRRQTRFVGPLEQRYGGYRPQVDVPCEECGGRGYAERSRVEREAPTLWVPADVGLVEIDERGVHVVRRAPLRDPVGLRSDGELTDLIRWISWRPDPRHAAARLDAPAKAV